MRPLIISACVLAFVAAGYSQGRVYGPEYDVPAVRVYLTDEETGGPLASRDAFAKYCWGWEVTVRTAEAERMPSTECTEVKIRSDVAGVAILPARTITPSRPVAPKGADFSTPRFKFAGIVVRDDKRDAYVSVYDAEVNLLDEKGEVHRLVPLKNRAK